MTTVRSLLAAAALWAGAFSATVAQAQATCVPAREAEALVLNMAPQLLSAAAGTCAATLSPSAYLRRPIAQIAAKFAADADAAWPLAREALKKLTGPDSAQILDSELARPVIGSMIAPMLSKTIKPRDCAGIDRVLGLIDPLPARNTAALIVTIVDLAGRDRAKRGTPMEITICPATPTR